MGKLSDSLQRTSEGLTADMLPSWTSIIITLAPIAIRALWRRKLRKDIKNDIKEHFENYMTEYRAPHKVALMERKRFRKKFKLNVMSQEAFEKLPIVDGKRRCPASFDYSDVVPGEVPCFFSENNAMSQEAFEKLPIVSGKRLCPPGFDYSDVVPGEVPCSFSKTFNKDKTNKIYLGGAHVWPPNSYIGANVIVGSHSVVGENTVLRECEILNSSKIRPGCIGKDCTISDSCHVGAGFIGLGGIHFGRGVKFAHGVDLRVGKGTKIGGYLIGDDAVIGSNFKMTGKNNVIGHNATIGSFSAIHGADIHKNGLEVGAGGLIQNCRFVDGDSLYNPSYSVNKCQIEGSKGVGSTMGEGGLFTNCVFEGAVISARDCEYHNCDFLDMPRIEAHSSLTDCHISTQSTCIVAENIIMVGGSMDGVVVEGSDTGLCRLIDVDLTNCELSYTHVEGDSLCADVEFGPMCEIKGPVKLDRTVQLTGDIKLRDYRIDKTFAPAVSKGTTVAFYRLEVENEELELHRSKKDDVQYKIFSSDLSHVNLLVANIDKLTLGKGVYSGDVASPESNIHINQQGTAGVSKRHQQIIKDEQQKQQKQQKQQIEQKDLGHNYAPPEPPVESYDSVALESISEHSTSEMDYQDYSESLSQSTNEHQGVKPSVSDKGVQRQVIKGIAPLEKFDPMPLIEKTDKEKEDNEVRNNINMGF